jgi:hypothetical protein
MAEKACHGFGSATQVGLTQALGLMFKFIAILIYIASIIAVLAVGGLVSSVLALYPITHLSSFGPVVPGIAQIHAGWLPTVQPITWAMGMVSAVIGVLLWRTRGSGDGKLKAALVVGAINYFLALFFTTSLLVAYFYLPKVANAA